jgi:type VI secretion system secreted protein Hcp
MAIYMKIDTIKGDVTAAGYTEWIAIHSLQFGVGRGISSQVGGAAKREASAPSISEVTITKSFDKSSIELFAWSLAGKSKLVKIDLVQTGTKDQLNAYLKYELTNTLLSGYSLSSGGDLPTESISLNFTKITEKYTQYKDDNAVGQPVLKGYDLATAKVV